ncbi:MAG: serine hydrolase domain-containing protein, partial [Balneolaceae bacterium]
MQKFFTTGSILFFTFFAILTLFPAIFYLISAQDIHFEDAWAQTESIFHKNLQEKNIVGGALLFFDEGTVKADYFYGLADISEQRPVDENTIFHWASNTKTFTAIAI